MINSKLATDAQMNKGEATGTKNVQIYIDALTGALKCIGPNGVVSTLDPATATFLPLPA